MLDAWCLMLDACCLMPDACLLLAAWCLNTCQTHPQRVPQRGGRPKTAPPFVEAAEGRLPLWMGLAGVQASSIKHQASVLSPINTPRKLKHFWPHRYRLFVGARLFQILRFSDFPFQKCWVWEVWYYQSGPKSVTINLYGIPENPKPLRNCQSLYWVQKN